jgi:hypothetical protein
VRGKIHFSLIEFGPSLLLLLLLLLQRDSRRNEAETTRGTWQIGRSKKRLGRAIFLNTS